MNNRTYEQSIYFDADILINYFADQNIRKHAKKAKEISRHAKKVIHQARKMCKNPEIIIKVPLIVLGELTMETIEQDGITLSSLFGRVIDAEFTSGSRDSYKIASELMGKDDRLTPADALLVAQALTNKTSEWLITTDGNLINNLAISKIKDKLGSGLKISDRF